MGSSFGAIGNFVECRVNGCCCRYGIIIFDGSFEECITERNDALADDRCKYTRSQIEDVELQARKIKAISPGTRVFSYHNMDLFLSSACCHVALALCRLLLCVCTEKSLRHQTAE